jgi:plasminogen activator inhibitor 1 RNA-binding protein
MLSRANAQALGRGGGDRHPTKGALHSNSEKQAAQSWGANEGDAELKDEQAAAEIAQSEQKAEGEAAEGEAKDEEPEEKQVTYDEFLAQQAEKKAALEADLQVRKPNEGVKDDKWKDFAPLTKKDEEEVLFAGSGGKAKRERERKTKQLVELENRYIEPAERTRGGRGGRGGARGDRGEGGRGRGDGARGRGRGAPRGEFRGEFRGGRGGGRAQDSKPLNPNDESAFPSLGGK